jgi:hypothetical protein
LHRNAAERKPHTGLQARAVAVLHVVHGAWHIRGGGIGVKRRRPVRILRNLQRCEEMSSTSASVPSCLQGSCMLC